MSKIENKWNQEVGPSFSEICDQLKKQMIDTETTKAQYIGKGEFVLFNDNEETPCQK